MKKIESKILMPLEIGVTYDTKFQTKDTFTITKIVKGKIDLIYGFYNKNESLTCLINSDRLVPHFYIKELNSSVSNAIDEYYTHFSNFVNLLKDVYTPDEIETISEHFQKMLK